MASASPSTTDPYPVFTGIWTNWSRGKTMGATLTLNRQDADLLIAFTAFFIAFISTRTWRISCFCFHSLFSTSSPQDVIYHQRQAILRNSSSPENGIYLFWKLMWAVRHWKRSCRILPTVITAVVCVTGFALAGGFSSRISTSIGNEVLVSSANCGAAVPPSFIEDADKFFAFEPYTAEKVTNAANYAQRCYLDSAGADCSLFITPRLQSTKDFNAPCPFSEGICRSQSGNIRLDSGYVDSHKHLGLNSPAGQRILWRQVVHCAPLATEGFTSQENSSQAFTRYHYGNRTLSNGHLDYIYKVPSVESQYAALLSEDSAVSHATYNMHTLKISLKGNATDMRNSDFEPIAALTRRDADTTFILLSGNGVTFSNSVPDDWYRVSSSPIDIPIGNINGTVGWPVYLPSEPGSPLGCAIQHQFCKSGSGSNQCGLLSSLRDAVAGVAPLFDTEYAEIAAGRLNGTARTENAAISSFVWMFFGFSKSIHEVFTKLGPMALLSQRTLISSVQGPLAPNQWQQDITYAWNISLALIQGSIIDAVYGPSEPDYLQSWVNFTSPSLEKVCSNQKILSTSYGSFSLVGLLSIFIAGFLLTIASYLLEPVSSFLCKKGYRKYAHLEWTTNTVLQLQRLAHEELGLGTWSGCADTVPTTKAAEVMASLDVTNIHHPVLSMPEKSEGDTSGEVPQAPEEPQDRTVPVSPADPGEPRTSVSHEIPDVILGKIAEPQEDEPGVASREKGGMEFQNVDELERMETGVGPNPLCWEDGSPLLAKNTSTETETAASSHLSQAETGNSDYAVANSATAAHASAADTETLISPSQPVARQDS